MSKKKFKLDIPSSFGEFKDTSFIGNSNLGNLGNLGNSVMTSTESTPTTMSMLAKWVPLICAGAAVGVSVIALKEIKNVRKDLVNLKKEQPVDKEADKKFEETNKRIQEMDEQLKKITKYLTNQNKPTKPESVNKPIIKEAVKTEKVNIINSDEEYEEVEVTDDEEGS